MRVLIVVDTLDPSWGGTLEAARQLGIGLHDFGHDVQFVTLDAPSSPVLKTCPLPVHAVGPTVTSLMFTPRLARWIRENRAQFDLVVLNNIWRYSSVGSWFGLRGSRVPYVVFTHGMLDPWFRKSSRLKHLQKLVAWKVCVSEILTGAAAVVFTSEEEQDLAASWFAPNQIRPAVVGLGIETPRFDAGSGRNDFYKAFPALTGRDFLLFLGRLHPKKGPDLLLEAFAKAQQTNPSIVLVFAGPGDDAYLARLKRLAVNLSCADRVFWLGPLFGPMKWSALACAKLFILPSHSENFAVTVVEAMAVGTPVLVTRRVNIWRQITDAGAALVCDDTATSVEKGIRAWFTLSDAERRDMGERALDCFRSTYQPEHFINRFHTAVLDTLSSTVTSRPNPRP